MTKIFGQNVCVIISFWNHQFFNSILRILTVWLFHTLLSRIILLLLLLLLLLLFGLFVQTCFLFRDRRAQLNKTALHDELFRQTMKYSLIERWVQTTSFGYSDSTRLKIPACFIGQN